MKKKKSKNNGTFVTVFSILLYIVAGGVIGSFIYVPSEGGTMLSLFVFFISVYVSMVIHVILHELGHMVCGLISGYRFLFSRIYSIMLVKIDGKLRFKRLSVAGTAGQCIMLPPKDIAYEDIPFLLYNIGGVLSNLLFTAIFILLYFLVPLPPQFNVVFPCLAVMGIILALTNGIPLNNGVNVNDGYNIMSMVKNKSARRAFAIQLEMTGMLAMGTRVSEMPAEWFTLPAEDEMNDPLSAFVAVSCVDRLMDEKRFDESLEAIEYIIKSSDCISGLHRAMLTCNRMYCEMINGASRDVIDAMRTKEQNVIMKQMKNFPVVIRTEYVYELLCKQDRARSIDIMVRFEKVAKTYPYPTDAACERELMAVAEDKYMIMKGVANVKK